MKYSMYNNLDNLIVIIVLHFITMIKHSIRYKVELLLLNEIFFKHFLTNLFYVFYTTNDKLLKFILKNIKLSQTYQNILYSKQYFKFIKIVLFCY